MARKPQPLEDWLKEDKERQDWIDQELHNEGLRRFTEVGQSRVDALISDLNQALPEGADRAEAIRRLKLRWRVFKCTQKNETATLSVSVNKRTLKSLKKLANSRGETQKATLEKLIEEGLQTEADKKAAIEKAVQQADKLMADKQSPETWTPFKAPFTREIEALKEKILRKEMKIQALEEDKAKLIASKKDEYKENDTSQKAQSEPLESTESNDERPAKLTMIGGTMKWPSS